MLGLGTEDKPKVQKTEKSDKKDNKQAGTSQSDEAKAILAKMQAKKDGGDCPFC